MMFRVLFSILILIGAFLIGLLISSLIFSILERNSNKIDLLFCSLLFSIWIFILFNPLKRFSEFKNEKWISVLIFTFSLLLSLLYFFFKHTSFETDTEIKAYKSEDIPIPDKFYERYFSMAEMAFNQENYAQASYWYQEYLDAISYKNDTELTFKQKLAKNRKLASNLLLLVTLNEGDSTIAKK